MSYNEIKALEVRLSEAKATFSLRQNFIKHFLNVGDTVHIIGGWENEYYPQKIIGIDLERAELEVLEESIDQVTKIDYFYVEFMGNITSVNEVSRRIFN